MKTSVLIALLVGAVACSSRNGSGEAPAPEPTAPVSPTATGPTGTGSPAVIDAMPDGLTRARARAADALQAETDGVNLEVNVLDGPGNTKIVRARYPDAYPGTGVAGLIYDPTTGATYGRRGEKPLADLVRARGWLEKPLPEADLIRLVHEARFDGLLSLQDASVSREANGLQVRLPAHKMDGTLDRIWLVTIPASGAETVKQQ